jgi:capsular exopolysaccharide synthesis family protein
VPFQVNEAINTLRGNIQLSGFDIKVIGITSSLPHEGKSSVSFRLAQSFAALNRHTLYIDCDIRNSRTLTRYEVREKVKGLTEFLCGEAALEEIVYKSGDSYMDCVFTGAVAPNPSELFSGERFSRLMDEMRRHYEYIIVDTPPINAVIDGVLIAKECDGSVLVVESGVTDRIQTMRAKQQLEYAGVKVLGVVLNKMGSKKSGYGHGYGYGYGYGEETGKDKKKSRKEA